jgi:hypothetical protein
MRAPPICAKIGCRCATLPGMSQHAVASFHRRQSEQSALFAVRASALVLAVCLAVHVLNGLVLERTFLHLDSYRDYADLEKLRDAFGSPLWVASGLAHLVTAAAIVWLGVSLARLLAAERPTVAQTLRVVSGVASAGFLLLAVTLLQAARSTAMLADENPEQADSFWAALSVVNVAADGLAVAAAGALVLVAARAFRRDWPRWFVRLSYVAAACGLLQAIVYAPLFLLAGLAWFVSLFMVLGRDA